MARTWVTGDLHGGDDFGDIQAWLALRGDEVQSDDRLLILGDFGLVWGKRTHKQHDLLRRLNDRRWGDTLWVDGNHEDFDQIEAWPTEEWHGGLVQRVPGFPHVIHLMRGEVYDMGDEGLWFSMGGARSVDRAWRAPHESWWPQEVPSQAEREHAIASLDAVGWEVDYVLTHDCPAGLVPRAVPMAGQLDGPPWPYEHERWLQFLDDHMAYRRWYLGHFHQDGDLDDWHTLLYHQTIPLGESLGAAPAPDVVQDRFGFWHRA